MTAYALLIDYEYCTGCHSCEVSCKQEHNFPVGRWGIRLYEDGPWKKDDLSDEGRSYNWNQIPVPTDLCDGCAERLSRGREPVCVHNCLGACMQFGTVEEMAVELAAKDKAVMWKIKA